MTPHAGINEQTAKNVKLRRFWVCEHPKETTLEKLLVSLVQLRFNTTTLLYVFLFYFISVLLKKQFRRHKIYGASRGGAYEWFYRTRSSLHRE